MYRLDLPSTCKILPVFHVSQLQHVLCTGHSVMLLPEFLLEMDELVWFHEELMDSRYDEEDLMEVLVR